MGYNSTLYIYSLFFLSRYTQLYYNIIFILLITIVPFL